MSWKPLGSPSGAPPGCSTATGISTINTFFAAMREADSTNLARATSALSNGQFVFSTGNFTNTDAFVHANSISELLSYARKRARLHEHIAIQRETFNYWRARNCPRDSRRTEAHQRRTKTRVSEIDWVLGRRRR